MELAQVRRRLRESAQEALSAGGESVRRELVRLSLERDRLERVLRGGLDEGGAPRMRIEISPLFADSPSALQARVADLPRDVTQDLMLEGP